MNSGELLVLLVLVTGMYGGFGIESTDEPSNESHGDAGAPNSERVNTSTTRAELVSSPPPQQQILRGSGHVTDSSTRRHYLFRPSLRNIPTILTGPDSAATDSMSIGVMVVAGLYAGGGGGHHPSPAVALTLAADSVTSARDGVDFALFPIYDDSACTTCR
jgi:hypothetical protein